MTNLGHHLLALGAFPGLWGPVTLLHWGPFMARRGRHPLALGPFLVRRAHHPLALGPITLLHWGSSLARGVDVAPSQLSQQCRPSACLMFLGGM